MNILTTSRSRIGRRLLALSVGSLGAAFVGDVQETREEWETDRRDFELPEGTRSLYVSLIVGGMVGRFDFDDLAVTPSDAGAANPSARFDGPARSR